MINTKGVIYTIIMLLLAFLLFRNMESLTFPMNADLRIVTIAIYYVGTVTTIGLAGLPWIFKSDNQKVISH